jgi:hypothetical protein
MTSMDLDEKALEAIINLAGPVRENGLGAVDHCC